MASERAADPADHTRAVPADPGETTRVSVVAVHGIGSQLKGQTLRAVVNALVEAWDEPGLTVTLSDTVLRRDEPSSEIQVWSQGVPQLIITVREAHWAESFYPPGARQVLGWVTGVAPLLLVARGVEQVDAALARWWRHPLQWWRIVLATTLVALVFPVLLLALVALSVITLVRAVIPVTWVKDALKTAEGLLSNVLGDSYLYLRSPADGNAIDTAVAAQIHGAAASGAPVVVLAHSQGAQVALRALAVSRTEIAHLVTVGSGIGQLESMRRLDHTQGVRLGGLAVWVTGLLLPSAILGTIVLADQRGYERVLAALLIANAPWVAGALVCAGVQWVRRRALREAVLAAPGEDRASLAGSVKVWSDLSATADPVSGTAVLHHLDRRVMQHRVVNGNSLLTDHTSYYSNRYEVLPFLRSVIVSASTGAPVDLTEWDRHRGERHRAGRWLVGVRSLTAASVVLVIASWWRHFQGWAADLWTWLSTRSPKWTQLPQDPPALMGLLEVPTLALAAGAVLLSVAPFLPALLIARSWRDRRGVSSPARAAPEPAVVAWTLFGLVTTWIVTQAPTVADPFRLIIEALGPVLIVVVGAALLSKRLSVLRRVEDMHVLGAVGALLTFFAAVQKSGVPWADSFGAMGLAVLAGFLVYVGFVAASRWNDHRRTEAQPGPAVVEAPYGLYGATAALLLTALLTVYALAPVHRLVGLDLGIFLMGVFFFLGPVYVGLCTYDNPLLPRWVRRSWWVVALALFAVGLYRYVTALGG